MPDGAQNSWNNRGAGLHPAVVAAAEIALRSPLATLVTDSLTPGTPVVFANDAFLGKMRLPRETVLARPLMGLLSGSPDSSVLSLFQSALENGHSGQWQVRIKTDAGALISTVVYLSPLRDEIGRIVGHNVNIADPPPPDRTAGEKDWFHSGIYDDAPGFIAISAGVDHVFEYTNASYRDFVKRPDLVGRTVAEALPEIAAQGFLTLLDEVYRTGVPFRGTSLPISIHDQATGCLQQCWINVLYQPVRDASGAIVGLFCEGHDVTRLHLLNEAMAELELKMIHVSRVNAMGTMAATLAHELNQPLTSISNYLAGVRPVADKLPDTGHLAEALDGIREASERASAIIGHLRQLTRHPKPSREPFNLRPAVDECVQLVRCSCRSDIVFDNQVAPDAVMIADRVKIQQVLINLLQNAGEAMLESEGNLIVIAANEDQRNVTVCITDTGSGVSPEAAETMFSWSSSSKDDGMGIGLSICRTIVELYRGKIWLESTGPKGSEFRFSLPVPDRSKRTKLAGSAVQD